MLGAPGESEPRLYYEAVTAAVDVPVLAYHLPAMSAPGLAVDGLRELPIAGLKDSSGDPQRLALELDELPHGLYVGSAALLLQARAMGCRGAILAVANVDLDGCRRAWDGDGKAQAGLVIGHRAGALAGIGGLERAGAGRTDRGRASLGRMGDGGGVVGPPSPASPWPRRWRRVAIAVGTVLAALVLVPEPAVTPLVERAVDRYGSDCVEMTGFRVTDAGRWPVVVRAAAGSLRDVAVEADEVVVDGQFTLHDVDFRADEIGVAALRFGLDGGDAEIRGGRSSATVRFADLERSLDGIGIDAALRWDGSRLVADVQVPFLGTVPTSVDWQGVDGDLELVFAPLDVLPLPPLRIEFADPIAFAELGRPSGRAGAAGDDAVRIDATIDGTLPADSWACPAP